MFGTLMESRRHGQHRTRESVVSIIVHGVIIAAAVVATARDSISAVPKQPPIVVAVHPFNPPPVVVSRRTLTTGSTNVPSAPAIPTIQVPVITPVGIAPIELNTSRPTDFGVHHLIVEPCMPACSMTFGPKMDSSTWAPNDVMMQLRDRPVPPRYPERLRQAGIDGSVVVKFVVDTMGRVDLHSVEVVRSDHELFTQAVRESLAKMRFNPAVANNQKVPALAMMPFHFTLK